MVSAAESRANARRPDSISYNTEPSAKTSDRKSTGSPRTCSGDMYPSVPNTIPASVRARVTSAGSDAATPGSASPKSRSEIQDLDAPVGRHDDVLRLEIAMDDAAVVRGGEAARDLRRVLRRFAWRQRPAGHSIAKGGPVQQLHGRVCGAAAHAEIMDGEDVRMVKRGEHPRLAFEPRHAVGIGDEQFRQHLDRYEAAELQVARTIHLAHAAGSNGVQDFVSAEAAAGCEHHCRGRRDSVFITPLGTKPYDPVDV